jgi:hypothetical protein
MVAACAPFQPGAPAITPNSYTPTGFEQSITLKDTSVHYDPATLRVGATRDQIAQVYGEPNSSRTTDAGVIEDVYAFNPDGSKFANPKVYPRNIALGFLTMGTSVAVRQARLNLTEKKLTLYHVFYGSNDQVQSVTAERLSGAPETLPAPPTNSAGSE